MGIADASLQWPSELSRHSITSTVVTAGGKEHIAEGIVVEEAGALATSDVVYTAQPVPRCSAAAVILKALWTRLPLSVAAVLVVVVFVALLASHGLS